ncbi:heterokaryon incompatibility protein-domain-containing protein [Halenospora varia]|nr:heterokaryon incompatibility protein-domain-containing protein [Halenospora varia]
MAEFISSEAPLPYVYGPLDTSRHEIRLLNVHPGNAGTKVQANLIVVSLADSPSYEALSYTWGDSSQTSTIELFDGESAANSSKFVFKATTNLELALQHLRYSDGYLILWVDSICINQNDNIEKSSQVQQMSTIFASASRVCVWLGEEYGYSDHALALISECPKDLDAALDLLSKEERGLSWRALTFLVQRPYFSRSWIVQEVALAKDITIFCGSEECDWESFQLIVRALIAEANAYAIYKENPHPSATPPRCAALTEWNVPDSHYFNWFHGTRNISCLASTRISAGKAGLKNFLATCHGRAITNPKDVIFSVLGLASEAQSLDLEVNYEQETVDVFIDAVESIVNATGSLDILCHNNWTQVHNHSHSWVPRFAGGFEECNCEGYLVNSLTISEILVPDGGVVQELMVDKSPYTAAGDTKAAISFDKARRQISVQGVKIDEITKVLDLPVPYRGGIQIPKQWKGDVFNLSNTSSKDISKNKNFDPFWRTLVANREQLNIWTTDIDISSLSTYNDILSLNNYTYLSQYRAPAPSAWASEAEEWLKGDMTVPDTSTSEFLRGIIGYIRSKRFVMTRESMGLGPESAENGDIVCVLFGCSVPMVLRPVGDGSVGFYLVGEAYLHSMMDGEAIELLKDGKITVEDFAII